MDTEAVPICPLCGCTGSVMYDRMEDPVYKVPGQWNVRRCQGCHSLWLDPRPTAENLHLCYEEYFTHEQGTQLLFTKGQQTVRGQLKAFLLPHRNSEQREFAHLFLQDVTPGRLLDVGCGDGVFLAKMRRHGWDVYGLETDATAAAAAAQAYGLKFEVGSIDETELSASDFDAITLSHVIEHVADPHYLLRRCRELLRPGGLLAIITPNIDSLVHRVFRRNWFGLDPPRHLILFNLASLLEATQSAHFKALRAETAARTASGVYTNSVGRIRKEDPQMKRSGEVILSSGRLLFVATEYWMNLVFKEVGEEIGILARKHGE